MISRRLLFAAKTPLACSQFQFRLSHSHRQGHGHSHGGPSSSLTEQKLQASRLGSGPLRRITVVGAGVNIALAVGKAVAGVLGHSAAMIADAAHSLSDLVSDAVTLFVLKQAHKPADSDHPYGHGKFESIGSLSMAALLVGTGGAIGWHSIQVLTALHSATAEAAAAAAPTSLALGAAIASVLIKEGLYHATMRVGQKHNSSVVVMNAWHHRVDGLTSLVALVGIGGSMLGIPAADPIAGILVAGAIVKVGIDSGVDSFHDLTDQQVFCDFVQVNNPLVNFIELGFNSDRWICAL
jgi:cation diffusion facilitator family transporter